MTHFFDALIGKSIPVSVTDVVIAGWAGREQSAIDAHINELREIGVTPPSRTPLFYRVSADLVTTQPRIQVLSDDTSGEAEVVLLGTAAGTYVGIGSDHTDRAAEAWSVAHAKQVCAKPVGPNLWPLEAVLPHWDELSLSSWTGRGDRAQLYQNGKVSGLLHPEALLRAYGLDHPRLAAGQLMFCGTLPLLDGEVRPTDHLRLALHDPVNGRTLEHQYQIDGLPVVA